MGRTPPATRTIGLITDFGLNDPYAGQMRAVLSRLAPASPVVDVSHGVRPFNITQGAFFLASSAPHFTRNSVLLTVVDPGVGSSRRVVALQCGEQLFLAPDNGLLGLVADLHRARAYDLSGAAQGMEKASRTFHGRDVFAPLAARLACGDVPSDMGPQLPVGDLVRPAWSKAEVGRSRARVHVLHVDHFGNCVLNLRVGEMVPPGEVRLRSPFDRQLRAVNTYSDLEQGGAGLLQGSQGFFELAVNRGSASLDFGLNIGDTLKLEWTP